MKGGHLIKEARKRAGLSQRQLAERLATSQSVVARWENGSRSPTLETVTRALRACGLDLQVSITPYDDHDLVLAERERRRTPAQRLKRLDETLEFERRVGHKASTTSKGARWSSGSKA